MTTNEVAPEKEPVKAELTIASPSELMRQASDVAGVCEKIVHNTAVRIKGKQYVKVEGWQSIATAHGCVAGIREVEPTKTGFRAVAELRRIDNGTMIATAEGFVGDDEETWAKRPEYARRAMAQTRAISRVCRSAFAHVVVLIDADLSTTPAEEVPFGGFEDNHVPKSRVLEQARREMRREDRGQKTEDRPPSSVVSPRFSNWRDCIMHFSKNAGKPLRDLNNQQLSWYYEEWMPKRKVNKDFPVTVKDQTLFDALEAWHKEVEKTEDRRQKTEEEPVMSAEEWAALQKQKSVEASWDVSDDIPMGNS